MVMVNWTVVFLFLLFPIYVVLRLETIVRKLAKIERTHSRENIKTHNARIVADQQRGTGTLSTHNEKE
jgi:Na+-transporting methylmalonyl-CoA/oxaloacetate decarboxylase gamma subunit